MYCNKQLTRKQPTTSDVHDDLKGLRKLTVVRVITNMAARNEMNE